MVAFSAMELRLAQAAGSDSGLQELTSEKVPVATTAKLDASKPQVLLEAVIFEIPINDSENLQHLGIHPRGTTVPFPSLSMLRVAGFLAGEPSFSQGPFTYHAIMKVGFEAAMSTLVTNQGVRIIQRPRIQTPVGEPAVLFVGQAKYIPGASSAAACGCYSTINLSQVGLTLEVTCSPSTNGSLLMDIQEQLDTNSGYVNIANVGDVPISRTRRSQAQMTVCGQETIVLGGFVETLKTPIFSKVAALDHVPLAGDFLNDLITRPTRKTPREMVLLFRSVILPPPEPLDLLILFRAEACLPGH